MHAKSFKLPELL